MRPDRVRAEAGMTMVELLITVVVTGIIISVICAALIMALQLGPQVNARSVAAGQGAFLVSTLSDDVANATAVAQNPIGAPADTTDCAIPGNNGSAFGYAGLDTFTLLNGSTAAYSMTITTGTPAVPNYYAVEVDRTVGSAKTSMLQGYCHAGDTGIVSAGFADPTYTFDLKLRAAPGAEVRELAFVANRRGFTHS